VRRQPRRHHDLEVWRDALDLVEAVYRVTASFPADERFGLTSQLRRAAVSVPSNIAEGSARRTRAELLQFLYIARGSLAEIETQLQIARRLSYLTSDETLDELLDRTFARLGALLNSLKAPES
jgi:four helix bundle protein